MTLEELVEQIRALPGNLAVPEQGTVADQKRFDAGAALAQAEVAANIARAAQESLKMRVEIARGRGATWAMIGKAIGVSAWRAEQRYFEKRPFGARW